MVGDVSAFDCVEGGRTVDEALALVLLHLVILEGLFRVEISNLVMSCFVLICIQLSNAAFFPDPLLFFSDDVQLHTILVLIRVGLHRPLAVDIGNRRVFPDALLLILSIVALGLIFFVGIVVLQRDFFLNVEVHVLAWMFVVLPQQRTSIVIVILLFGVVYRRLAYVGRCIKQYFERSLIQRLFILLRLRNTNNDQLTLLSQRLQLPLNLHTAFLRPQQLLKLRLQLFPQPLRVLFLILDGFREPLDEVIEAIVFVDIQLNNLLADSELKSKQVALVIFLHFLFLKLLIEKIH